MNVAVLHAYVPSDAPKDEQDTLEEVEAVSGVLAKLGYKPEPVAATLDLSAVAERLLAMKPAFVFNLVESIAGKGSLIHLAPALLDYLGLKYTGSPTEAMFATSNKLVAKRMMAGAGIPTAPWFAPDGRAECGELTGRCIIKSVWEHASVGLTDDSVVDAGDHAELLRVIKRSSGGPAGRCFAEAYIEGREFNVSVLQSDGEPEVLPPAEMRFMNYPEGRPKLVNYHAKWVEGTFEYKNTERTFNLQPTDGPLVETLRGLTRDCWRFFGLMGYARVDFRVDEAGRPWVLEVNANPCLSPEVGIVAAAEHVGMAYDQLIERIVRFGGVS